MDHTFRDLFRMVRLVDLMEFTSTQMDLINEVILLMVHYKDMGNLYLEQEISCMKETGQKMYLMEKELRYIQMDQDIKAILLMEERMMRMQHIDGIMVKFMLVPSKMDIWKELAD